MILGNPKKINLGTSSYHKMRTGDCLYIDKTRFIENFLNEPSDAQLIVRQRRLGKSLNLDTLRLFLSDKENTADLFKDTYIKTSAVWDKLNSAPVFLFDFKHLSRDTYKEEIKEQVIQQIIRYFGWDTLTGNARRKFEKYDNGDANNPNGLLILTEIVYEVTGKQSYILIDEYDKLLTDNYNNAKYNEIKEYETNFLSAGLKGNNYLAKSMMTGVMRVSRESILSGLNNLKTYDLFTDNIYTDDFGFKEEEITELRKHYDFDTDKLRLWYNGIKIRGRAIYNTYSVASFLESGELENYWGQSGTIEIIAELLDHEKREAIMKLLNGEVIKTNVSKRISLAELTIPCDDGVFYSFLLQTGYVSLEEIDEDNIGTLKIPNIELMRVWKEFILTSVVKNSGMARTFFGNIDNPAAFSRDVEHFLNDRMSYFDLDTPEVNEKLYHIFVLGILSAYKDSKYIKPPLSNLESGDGRYDILIERRDYSVIFEFKTADNADTLLIKAQEGLEQINEKRYYASSPVTKPLIKTAVAFYKKQCRAVSERHKTQE